MKPGHIVVPERDTPVLNDVPDVQDYATVLVSKGAVIQNPNLIQRNFYPTPRQLLDFLNSEATGIHNRREIAQLGITHESAKLV